MRDDSIVVVEWIDSGACRLDQCSQEDRQDTWMVERVMTKV